MRRLAVGAVLLGVACGGGDGGGPAVGNIQGLVRDTTGAALEAVNVLLRNPGTTTTVRAVATNATGTYTFVGVATGSYDVVVQEPAATEVTGANPLAVSVTTGSTAQADFSLRLLPVSFASHVQPLFTASCSSGGCHGGAAPQQGMDLSASMAYGNIVNVASTELPAMDRVEPSTPAQSYLIHKIEGTQASVGGSGARMPLGVPALALQTQRMIRRWVSEGALNN